MLSSLRIENTLSDRYGIGLEAVINEKPDDTRIIVRAKDLPSPNGFSIEIQLGWRSVSVVFNPDSFSSALMREMYKASNEKKNAFTAFLSKIKDHGAKVEIKADEISIQLDRDRWPENQWRQLSISMDKVGVDLGERSDETVIDLITPFVGLIVALLPLEEHDHILNDGESGLPEGAKTKVLVNKYERSHINREACLVIFGPRCKTCGLDMGEKYGTLGRGYIHVHHIVPVSQLGNNYIVDPAKDLIPVCPNCHAMLHQKDPPISIEGLRSITNYHP